MLPERYLERFNYEGNFPYRNGCVAVFAGDDCARSELVIDPGRHYNSVGVVHGAVYLMIADSVAAVAANTDGEIRLSTVGSYEMLGSAREGTLHAEATLMRKTNRLIYHRVEIRDDAGALVFHATVQSFRAAKKG